MVFGRLRNRANKFNICKMSLRIIILQHNHPAYENNQHPL